MSAWQRCSFARTQGPEFQSTSDLRSLFTRARLALEEFAGLRGSDAVPIYWENAHRDHTRGQERGGPDFFDDVYPLAMDQRAALQELLNATGGDGEEGPAFRLVRALRLESSAIWGRYQAQVARIRRKRGPCAFAGRGPPLTSGALLDGGGAGAFARDLDPGICEAYLWHGTGPQVALRILHGGFRVDGRTSAGKRFGAGGYFSEDPVKADAYAKAGEGLYSGCRAMLLCRVVLGRQFRTSAFREESARELAGRGHDSTLAEPRGASWREFVVFGGEQVYPEYALVYEHCAAGRREGVPQPLCEAGSEAGSEAEQDSAVDPEAPYPAYWFHGATTGGCFHETYPAEAAMPFIQGLLESTWEARSSTARLGADGRRLAPKDRPAATPQGLRVLKVLRVEDSDLWAEYQGAQEAIREARGGGELPGPPGLRTMEALPAQERRRLADDVNEAYLLHGSSPKTVSAVLEGGFPADLSRFNHGPFGDGAYFVESAVQADEYSEDDRDGYYMGYYAMLLCRVALGSSQALPGADAAAHERLGQGREFDSAWGHTEASDGSFREFLVPSRAQVYPEYAIIYERVYSTARVRGVRLSREPPPGGGG